MYYNSIFIGKYFLWATHLPHGDYLDTNLNLEFRFHHYAIKYFWLVLS